jgi:inner membrane protein
LLIVPSRSGAHKQFVLPHDLKVSGQLDVLERYRGIFRYPTYSAHLEISGEFALPGMPAEDLAWDRAAWVLLSDGDSDLDGLEAEVDWQGARTAGELQRDAFGLAGLAYVSPVAVPPAPGHKLSFRASVNASGAESLALRPWGREVSVQLRSAWPAPSFGGDRLPTTRKVDADGFDATWDIGQRGSALTSIGQILPSYLERSSQLSVRLVEDVSHYQLVTRTAKYALLVIALTFSAFYLFEIVAGLHIHVIQYALVGFALVLFYMLLFSQSEHVPFAWAYLIASTATVGLITAYTRAILAGTAHALLCGTGLSATYGLLFVILREERFALLTGSWALFLVLAAIMYLTRRLDWGSLSTPAR